MQQPRWLRQTLVATALSASLPLLAQSQAPAPALQSHAAAPAVQSPAPTAADGMPDTAALLKEVRARIPLDVDLQSQYSCIQRETEVRLDGDGHPTSTTVREYQIYPAMDGMPPFKRLVSGDGAPVSQGELAELAKRHREELESAGDREKRARQEAQELRDRKALVDEFFRLFEFHVTGREILSGRPTLLVSFAPRPGLTASSRAASIAQKFVGRAWVDEQDLQVVRVEAKSTEDLNYGFGMFARIFKGTTVLWERRKVDDGPWVPARLEIRASARVLLFRRLGLHRVTDYLDYRRVFSNSAQVR